MKGSKDEIRKFIEKRRDGLDDTIKKSMDNRIFNLIIGHNLFKDASVIFTYVSFKGEVNTHNIINYALKEGKTICVPKIIDKSKGMALFKIEDLSSLSPGYCGILEPQVNLGTLSIDCVDLIIVPGLAFDMRGGRIGYGGGFYDRLLASSSADVSKVALAYEFQVFDKIPTDKWDKGVDMIMTEERIIDCRYENNLNNLL
ncbi:MAG TPA: 5-formyltetrahydrofolate cyclo-ligase [Clostridiales bacterium]|nr:5-formyltetrahydrofolate cyclo-ligase [Clostridiales bacterium]